MSTQNAYTISGRGDFVSIFDFGIGSAHSLAIHERTHVHSEVTNNGHRPNKISKKAGLTILIGLLSFIGFAAMINYSVVFSMERGKRILFNQASNINDSNTFLRNTRQDE